jgi:hypothetical protein
VYTSHAFDEVLAMYLEKQPDGAPARPMRTVFAGFDESFLLSVQIALDANGIRHHEAIEHVGDSVMRHSQAVLVDDADFARALEIVQSLQRTAQGPAWDRRSKRIALALVSSVVLVMALLWFIR